jgi:hypothetical protein
LSNNTVIANSNTCMCIAFQNIINLSTHVFLFAIQVWVAFANSNTTNMGVHSIV